MDHFHLVELGHVDPADDPGAVLTALSEVEQIHRTLEFARHANDYRTLPAVAMLRQHAVSRLHDKIVLLALRGRPNVNGLGEHGLRLLLPDSHFDPGDVIGAAFVTLPKLDNPDLVRDLTIDVHPAWQRRGVGRALSAAVDLLASRRGRSTLTGWSTATGSDAPDALRASVGDIGVAPDAGTGFARAMGYTLSQIERLGVQDLAGHELLPPQVADGYRLESWQGPTPAAHLSHIAELQGVMSTDTPFAELPFEAEPWDAERVVTYDRLVLASHDSIMSLAVHEATGRPAGYTQFVRAPQRPAAVEQWNTIVAREHRGHGLARSLKLANLALLSKVWPDAEHIHTWNAAENDAMWAINEQLGYRTASYDVGWRKNLNAG